MITLDFVDYDEEKCCLDDYLKVFKIYEIFKS